MSASGMSTGNLDQDDKHFYPVQQTELMLLGIKKQPSVTLEIDDMPIFYFFFFLQAHFCHPS